jgi:thiol-disulfide isomerase/thioredoxin
MLAAALLGIAAAGSTAKESVVQPSLLRKQAPEFALTDLDNRPLDLKAYRGKVVLLNFWATWCAPCQLEMPRFIAWQREYGSSGLRIVGISMDDDPALVRQLTAKLKLNYPVAMGDEKIGGLFGGVLGLPVTYLIDRNGTVSAEYRGETDLDAMEKQLKLLLEVK